MNIFADRLYNCHPVRFHACVMFELFGFMIYLKFNNTCIYIFINIYLYIFPASSSRKREGKSHPWRSRKKWCRK